MINNIVISTFIREYNIFKLKFAINIFNLFFAGIIFNIMCKQNFTNRCNRLKTLRDSREKSYKRRYLINNSRKIALIKSNITYLYFFVISKLTCKSQTYNLEYLKNSPTYRTKSRLNHIKRIALFSNLVKL